MMNNVTLKNGLYCLVVVSAAVTFLLAYVYGLDLLKARDSIDLISKVVGVDLLVVGAFVRWGWKFPMFRGWLVPFPNLNGSWVGFINSNWEDPLTSEEPRPISALLTVKQSFFHISCVMRTSEMESVSYCSGFLINPEQQIKKLAYSYTSKPRRRFEARSTPHDGTVLFKILQSPKQKLVGAYWTDRKSTGEITLEYHSKELLEELPESCDEHSVTESEEQRRSSAQREGKASD